jgi:hypothetical protein
VGRRGDPGTGPPAVHFGVTLSAAGRPLAAEASTRVATLSSTVHTTGQTGGDPVLHRPAVQLGVTLPSAVLEFCAAAVFFSLAPCRKCLVR